MPQAPVLRNTCHGPRTPIPQRAGCLPPHTDRVQQDIHPPDNPAPSTQKSENAMWGTTSRPTTRKQPARAQLCRRRCAGQLRQPAPRRRPSTTGCKKNCVLAEMRKHCRIHPAIATMNPATMNPATMNPSIPLYMHTVACHDPVTTKNAFEEFIMQFSDKELNLYSPQEKRQMHGLHMQDVHFRTLCDQMDDEITKLRFGNTHSIQQLVAGIMNKQGKMEVDGACMRMHSRNVCARWFCSCFCHSRYQVGSSLG